MDKSRHDKAGGHAVGVGGRLKQRLAQILRHSSCATTSATAFVGVSTINNTLPPVTVTNNQEPPPPRFAHEPQPKLIHGRCQRRRHRRRSSRAALLHISIDCSTRSVGAAVLPSPPAPARDARAVKKKGSGNKLSSLLYSWSSSSSDTEDDELAPFSSEGERGQATTDTRSSTVFSSHSFSSDSTVDFYNATRSRRRRHKNTPPRRGPTFRPTAASAAAGKHEKEKKKKKQVEREDDGSVAAGSTAVVKRSHNPYADFRRSMVEMVSSGRRSLRGADALSELLVWYLSLNSPRHHPAILAAFEDVWEAVLGNDDRP